MRSEIETRSWFFWLAALVSTLGLSALSAALIIGLQQGSRISGPARSYVLIYFLVALTFWLLATLIGLAKPGETTIRVGFAASMGIAIQLAARSLDPVLNVLTPAEFAYSRLLFLASPLHFACAFEFFYRFPAGPIRGRVWNAARLLLWSFAIVVWAIRVPRVWAWAWGGVSLNETWVWPLEQTALACFAAAITVSIVVNYRRLSGPDQRRRLQWIAAGAAGTTVPQVLLALMNAGGAGFNLSHPLTFGVELSAVLVPLTMMYAILRRRTLGLQVILRRSLQYLLAKSVLWVLVALPFVLLGVDLALHADQKLADLLAHNPAALVFALAAAIGLNRREKLTRWLDRKFFRETHDRKQLLVRLVDETHGDDSLDNAAKLVVSLIETALHPRVVRMYIADGSTGGFTLAHSTGEDSPTMPDRVPAAAGLAVSQAWKRMPGVVEVSSFPPDIASWAEAQSAVLAVRISGGESPPAGLLLLGEKLSEEPYTADDRSLLESVAKQAGMLFEHDRLKLRLDDEQRIQRDVLARLGASEINLVKECPVCGECYDSADRTCKHDGAELTLAVPAPRVVGGRYRLERRLGRGGMGTVYVAFDDSLQRHVAVKVMMGSLFGNRAAIRRFEREARAASRLSHPNIISVHDYGAIGSDGAYLVMEMVRGSTWRAALRTAGLFSPGLAAKRIDQLIEGVKAAHAAGIVHRDLKPENVMISDGEQIKVLDFGLAKLAKDLQHTTELTVPGAVLGTAGYMSYEQLTGEEADERSDIFSLGVIASEAITGRRPFDGRTMAELAQAMLKSEWHLPADPTVRSVLMRCLARDPADRFATAAQLQQELIPAIIAGAPEEIATPRGDNAPSTLTLGGTNPARSAPGMQH